MDYNVTYRKKDKGIQVIISYKDNNGKWKQKSKQGFKIQKDAKPFINQTLKELKEQLESENNAINDDYNSITFKNVANAFIEHSKLYREYNTIKGYKIAIKKCELINNIEIINIKKADIIKCVDEMVRNNLKAVSIESYLRKIKQVFIYYKENYNPKFKIDFKINLPKDKISKEKKALTKTELNNLLKNEKLNKSKFYIAAYIAGKCGLRSGEI